MSTILFLYEVVVGKRLPWMNDIVRAQRPVRLPVVGHRDVSTTMIYTHVLNQGGRGVRSPLDQFVSG